MRTSLVALFGLLSSLAPALASAEPGESSFTPSSFLMPIRSVMLATTSPEGGYMGGGNLYSCAPSDPNGCLVDMAEDAALAALFSEAAEVPEGTYDTIFVNTCQNEETFVAKLKGSVELEGTTFYTTSGSTPLSASSDELDYASITYGGCSAAVKLSAPVVVAAGDSLTVSAFFTLENLAWVLTSNSPGLGGCAAAEAGRSNVCSGLPVLVASIGETTPTLRSFLISEDPNDLQAATAGGQVLLLSDAGGQPFAGFLRRVYSHDSLPPSVSYDVPLRSVTPNGAGMPAIYTIASYGDPAQDEDKFRVKFPEFVLGDHTGTLLTANGAATINYRTVER